MAVEAIGSVCSTSVVSAGNISKQATSEGIFFQVLD